MGLISQHAGSPYEDGEVLSAGTADAPDGLELDVLRFYAEFNGGIDEGNLALDANLNGSKFAAKSIVGAKFGTAVVAQGKWLDGSLTSAKFADDAVTLAKLAVESVTKSEQFVDEALSGKSFTTDWVTLISDTIATGPGVAQRVLVLWAVTTGGTISANIDDQQFRLRRNNTVLFQTQLGEFRAANNANDAHSVTMMWLDTAAPQSSTVTYDVQMISDDTDATQFASGARLQIVNMRR